MNMKRNLVCCLLPEGFIRPFHPFERIGVEVPAPLTNNDREKNPRAMHVAPSTYSDSYFGGSMIIVELETETGLQSSFADQSRGWVGRDNLPASFVN